MRKEKDMGTFAGLYREPEAGIPDEKIEEFKARVEMLFQAGGMMEVESVSLFGKDIVTIRKAFMDEYGMDFIYNYFEDDFWENAGCDGDNGYVWSNKIGWRQFHTAVVAAYVLQELYMDGAAIAMVDLEFVTTLAYTGWINYLFDENFCFKNRDPWKLFEVMNEQEGDDHAIKRIDWSEFISDECGMLGYYEIYAVIYGTDAAIAKMLPYYEKAGGTDDNMNFYNCSKWIKEAILDFKEESTVSEEEQVLLLTEMFRKYYEQDSLLGPMGIKYEEDVLKKIRVLAVVSDVPAFIFKAIAEIYGKDFWELWRGVQDVARRRTVIGLQGMNHVVKKVTTQELFHQKDDDMIPYWSSDSDIHFSKELEEWFKELREQFDQIMKEEVKRDNSLKWIIDLMEYADEEYYQIYTFSEFFEETLEHLADRRYLALWKMYDCMLHRPDLEEAGSVIFVPEGEEYEHVGLHYLGEEPRRRLMFTWDMTDMDKRNNKARVTFRRYMALVANQELRKSVFGF